MSAPASVSINPAFATDFFVEEETPHVVTYKLWVLRGGSWTTIGPEETDDDRSDHWIFTPPMPSGSRFAYWLGIWGHANTQWRVRLHVAQRDPAQPDAPWTDCGTWTEEGVTDDQGNGGGVATLPSIPQVVLS